MLFISHSLYRILNYADIPNGLQKSAWSYSYFCFFFFGDAGWKLNLLDSLGNDCLCRVHAHYYSCTLSLLCSTSWQMRAWSNVYLQNTGLMTIIQIKIILVAPVQRAQWPNTVVSYIMEYFISLVALYSQPRVSISQPLVKKFGHVFAYHSKPLTTSTMMPISIRVKPANLFKWSSWQTWSKIS